MADRLSAIDAFFDREEEEERAQNLPAIDPMADMRSPDEAAQERVIAEEVGQPPQAVRAYPELFSQSAEQSRTRRATQGSPRLQAWLDQPDNYAVARDDVENLSIFEQLATHYLRQGDRYRMLGRDNADQAATSALVIDPIGASAHIARRLFEGGGDPFANEQARQGNLDVEYGRLAYRAQQTVRGEAPLSDEERARLDELATREGQENWGPFLLGPTRRLIPQLIETVRRAGQEGGRAADEVWDDPFTLREGERWNARRVLEGGVAAMAEAPPVAVASFGGAVEGYLRAGYEMETGIAYDAMVRDGIDPTIAADHAEEYGREATTIEFVSDVLLARISGAGKLAARALLAERILTRARPGVVAARRLAGSGVEQGFEETSQELAQIIHQDLAQQDQAAGGDRSGSRVRWSEVLTPEHIQQMLQAGYIGFQGGVGLGSIPAGANFAVDMRALSHADRAAFAFEEMTRAAQSSRLNERGLASTMESAIGAMDESNVYVDADRFVEHFQGAGVNAYAVAEELGLSEQTLATALASHGQVEIPTARFAARVLRVPAHAGLAQHARIAPDADTPAEAQAAAARIQAEVERIAEEAAVVQSDNEIGAAVETRMRELLARAAEEGGPRAEVSARYARLIAALPRALVARARATNPAYAEKLDASLRTLFSENVDVAGPGRPGQGASFVEMQQRGKGPDAGPVRADSWSPPEGVRISERARKIAEMAVNGASNEWIAEEMGVSRQNVSVTLDQVKNKLGGKAPWEPAPSGSAGRPPGVNLDRLVHARDQAVRSGYPRSEIIGMLADRFNTTKNNVKQRLWQHDKKQKAQAEAAAAEDAQKRRTQPFDLATPEGRQAWFEEETIALPIPGEAADARYYGFALDTGEVIVVTIAPEPTGSVTVDWTFLDRLREASRDDDVDLFGPGKEKLGVRGVSALMARVGAVLEADIAQFGRDSYVYTPNNEALEYIYERLVSRIIGAMPYSTTADNAGAFYLIRDGAEVLRNGTVVPSPENANAPRPDWPNLAPEEIKRLQAETYDRIERFAKEGADEGNRGDGGQADADRASDDAGGGVSGTGRAGEAELEQGDERGQPLGGLTPTAFDADGNMTAAIIRLYAYDNGRAYNLSTFLHETGHLFLEIFRGVGTDPAAPEELRQMWSQTLDWFGLTSDQWNALSYAERVPYHEKWAETFERYLMDGQAPSLSLREAFAVFKQWLLNVYRSIASFAARNPNARLSPEIREVFDRLIATDNEIAEARAAMGADFALSREAFKTEEEFAQYQQSIAEARDAQEADLRARAFDAYARKSKRWWRGERERMRDAATRAVDSEPARRAEQWLAFQEWRALPDTTLSDEGEVSYVAPANALEDMPEGLPSMQLSAEAIQQDWPNAQLPTSIRPRTDVETVLAEAMALKAQEKGRGQFRAQRLSSFIKKNGGIRDPDGRIKQALGSGRRRPGLINNESGKTPEEMMRLATEAGYFGEGAAREMRQGDGLDAGQSGEGRIDREEWVAPSLIPDEATEASRYRRTFGPLRSRFYADINPRGDGVARIDFRRDGQRGWSATGEGQGADALRALRALREIITDDMGRFQRNQYTLAAHTSHQADAYAAMARRYTPEGWTAYRTSPNNIEVVREGSPQAARFRSHEPIGASPSPDGGQRSVRNASLEDLRTQGFDVERPLYHFTTYDYETPMVGRYRGVYYLSDTPEGAQRGAAHGGMEHPALGGPAGEGVQSGPNVRPVFVRGRIFGRDPLPADWLPERITYGEYRRIVDGVDDWRPPESLNLTPRQIEMARFERQQAIRQYEEAVPESEFDNYRGARESEMPMRRPASFREDAMGYEGLEGPSAAERREFIQKLGYTGALVGDEAGTSIAMFPDIGGRTVSNIAPRFGRAPQRPNAGETLPGFEMFQGDRVQPRPLLAVHNTTAKKLLHAVRMGGMAVPSLAVIRADIGFDNFGDITLIAPPSLIDPRGGGSARVFDADVYSPRYPQVSFKVNERKFSALIERPVFQEASRDLGFKISTELDESTTRQNGMDAVLESTVIQLAYARMNGINVDIPIVEGYREGETRPDYWTVRQDLRERVGNDPAFMQWAEAEFGAAFEGERIFQGWTNAGNARYLPHNLDTVVRVLKRELRDGEGFNYGVGSIRSKVAREFRSLTAIKNARDQIVDSATMEALKNEANDEFVALANQFVEKSGRTSVRDQMGFLDVFSEHLKEVAETHRVSVMDQYYPSPLSDEEKASVVAFLEKLRALPTEYFEAKVRRAVGLNEFVAAVVPEGTDARTMEALSAAGITDIRTYPKGDVSARQRAVMQVRPTEMFAGANDKTPSLEEFLTTLIADLTGERQVYPAHDTNALASAQALSDAQEWFDAHEIDLSKDKETIRAQIVSAIEKDKASENQWHPDDIAPWFGMSSGDELVQALANLKPRNVAIEEQIDAMLEAEHGDAGSRSKMEASARDAAHAEVQAKRIEVELAALQKATGGRVKPVNAAARAYAEDQVEQMTLREVRNPEVFLAGERRAARAAFEAAKKKDWPEAARQKQKQLLSFWLYKFARDASENVTRIEGRWKRYSSSATTRAAIGPKHIEQIDAILDTIETGKPQYRPTQTLEEWAADLVAEDAADLIVFNPAAVEQQIRRPLSSMSYAEVKGLNDVLRNIETIGRGMIRLRNQREAQRIADIQQELKDRIRTEWKDQLARRVSLVAPNALDKSKLELQHIDAQLLKLDYLARLLDGLKDGGPWMGLMAQAQDAENDLHTRSQRATQEFLALVRAHYTPAQFREMLSKRIYIDAIEDNRTKAQIISAALNVGNDYNRDALLRGEKWSDGQLQALLSRLDENDWTFIQGLWNYVAQWKEESFALDERTRGSRPPEVIATPFTLPSGRTLAGGYWPVSFSSDRSEQAAQREARDTIIGEYGGQFRQAATNRGRLKARSGTAGQPLSDDFMGVLAKHVHDSLRDITHRELVITLRRVKSDKELRNMIARIRGRDAVRALDEWVHRLAARTPANVFGDYGRIAAYLRRAGTSHAMGFKVSVATLNLLGHLQAIPRNGIVAQMKQAGLSVAVGFPDLLRRHLQAIGTGQPEVSARVALVHEKSEMMRHRRNTFDRDINEVKGNLVGRREGAVLPKQLEDTLQILNAYTDQVVSVPTWLAAYESAKNGKVDGVSGEEASVAYADSVVRMTLSAGGTKDMAALIASNNQWQRLMTMFMGWASAFWNQMTVEQIPGVMSGKISLPRFAANMVWIWLLPAVVTTIFYGQNEQRDDEDEWQYWSRMALTGIIYPLQTIPLVRDLMSALVQGYRPQTPVGAVIDRSQKLASAIERGDERQMVKQGFLLAGQITGIPSQAYVTGDYVSDLVRGEEPSPLEDPMGSLEEALLRDTR